ncbi:ABC transporter ATP-binding protein [Rhizobium sp. NZLR1]|uniref:ABC transporter ATP-binding protein n=1 Tax=Rhizobium sp. NZLR1 TaxID=2731096 RepID=UPI001A99A9F8|nr:ABC transporter ATP-binding protein [Rhizobium sp. NZLR1]MBX5204039.1 ABC transporter ATP-binding protein [Rhizobium sp. NZLR1]QSZ25162.1 ABC transporter ATP-binding protein [Rhizobium sp. NZLR1]
MKPSYSDVSVSVSSVTKVFGTGRSALTVLNDVSFSVNAGEFVALIGPSGCGKSTLLRMIASLETPSSGRVLVGNHEPGRVAKEHSLGVAFQDHALLPWMNVAANISLPFSIARRPIDKRRVQMLIDLVGLTGFERAKPAQLSGGMRQRVSIARALALSPTLLLLDEPFGALDAVTRRQMNIELQKIWAAQKITTLLVTHGVDEALFLADRVMVMDARPGRIKRVVEVPFERPRGPKLLRDPRFHELVDELTEMLEVTEAA